MTPGFWATNFFPTDFFHEDFWQDFGVTVPVNVAAAFMMTRHSVGE